MRFLIPFAGMLVVVTAPVRSQQAAHAASPFDRTVTLTLEGVPLKDALDAVARQTGVRIAYSGRVVPLDRPVSVQLAAVRVEAALDTLLHGTGVASTLDGTGQILPVADRPVGAAVDKTGRSPAPGEAEFRHAGRGDSGTRPGDRIDHRQQRAVVRDRRPAGGAGRGREQ